MVQTVNNLRLTGVTPCILRMVLGRAVLRIGKIDVALAIRCATPPSGGFHFTLAQASEGRTVSVGFGTGVHVMDEVTRLMVHANHALHLDASQTVIPSARDRQARGDTLVAAPAGHHAVGDPACYRRRGALRRDDPESPDYENTLAAALVHVRQTRLRWVVCDRISDMAACSGEYQLG